MQKKEPLSIVAVLLQIVSSATGSYWHLTLNTGKGDLKFFLRIVDVGVLAYFITNSNVFLMIFIGKQLKQGFNTL